MVHYLTSRGQTILQSNLCCYHCLYLLIHSIFACYDVVYFTINITVYFAKMWLVLAVNVRMDEDGCTTPATKNCDVESCMGLDVERLKLFIKEKVKRKLLDRIISSCSMSHF